MQDRAIVADQSRKTPRINPEFLDQLLTRLGARCIERERDAIAGQPVTQLMAARRPLLTDNPVNDVAGPVGGCPGGQRILHLWIEPLLRAGPALGHPEVTPP